MLPAVREASSEELVDWDSWTVDAAGGNVFQSRAWGQYQAERGLRASFLVDAWGGRTLVLTRPWALIGGGSGYAPRGPRVDPAVEVDLAADRLQALSDWLARHAVDALASDAEVGVGSGYSSLLVARGFHPVEELQPSRHRLSLPLGPGADEAACLGRLSMSARQRVRGAMRDGLRVVRYDARPRPVDEQALLSLPADQLTAQALEAPLEAFYGVLRGTSERRGFRLAPLPRFVDWSTRAVLGGLAIFLEVRAPDGDPLGGGLFYRHGGRLTYATAGDRAEMRRAYPGVIHLLLWRAIQVALAEQALELDLGGVDIAGARRRPPEGDAMHGLLAFKESFGGEWLELVGNHQRTMRPLHYAAGRGLTRFAHVGQRFGLRGLTPGPAPA